MPAGTPRQIIDRMNTAAKASVANRLKRLQREVRRG